MQLFTEALAQTRKVQTEGVHSHTHTHTHSCGCVCMRIPSVCILHVNVNAYVHVMCVCMWGCVCPWCMCIDKRAEPLCVYALSLSLSHLSSCPHHGTPSIIIRCRQLKAKPHRRYVSLCDKMKKPYQSLLSVLLTVIAFNSPLILLSGLMSRAVKSQMLRLDHTRPSTTLITWQRHSASCDKLLTV